MNTSQQATGRLQWPRDDNYPWRVVVWNRTATICGEVVWTLYAIFECETEAVAHEQGEAMLRHYYVGEVA